MPSLVMPKVFMSQKWIDGSRLNKARPSLVMPKSLQVTEVDSWIIIKESKAQKQSLYRCPDERKKKARPTKISLYKFPG